MGSKICSKELKKYFEECGFKVLDIDCNGGICGKVNVLDRDGYKYFISANRLKRNIARGHQPYKFGKSNPHTLENIKLWIIINNKPYSFHGGEYLGNGKKNLFFQCNKCHEIWNAQWLVIETGVGCPYCDGKRIGESNCLGNLRPDLALEWDYEKNYPMTPKNIALRSSKKIWWICQDCSCRWLTSPSNRTGGLPGVSTNCPNCKKSSGEILIRRVLDTYHVEYMCQKTFMDCRYRRELSYDFFLHDFNCCIEYQGEQHYFPVNFGKMEKTLCEEKYFKQVEKDKIKLEYCKNNNIDLLIIPYWEFGHITQILYGRFIKM